MRRILELGISLRIHRRTHTVKSPQTEGSTESLDFTQRGPSENDISINKDKSGKGEIEELPWRRICWRAHMLRTWKISPHTEPI